MQIINKYTNNDFSEMLEGDTAATPQELAKEDFMAPPALSAIPTWDRNEIARIQEKVWIWLAWHLPKTLVKWAAVRLMAHATTGEYGSHHPDSVSIMDALERW